MEFTLTEQTEIDAELVLKETENLKDLFNIEFGNPEDNILLTDKKLRLIYEKLMEFDRRIKNLERI